MAWGSVIKAADKKFLSSTEAAGIKDSLAAMLNDDAADEERRDLARSITVAWFGSGPDRPIGESVDTPGECLEMADWLNYTIAPWVSGVSQYWAWSYCDPSELAQLQMKSHFAYLCYGHLHPKIPISNVLSSLSMPSAGKKGKKSAGKKKKRLGK